jgi:hypothetical protein
MAFPRAEPIIDAIRDHAIDTFRPTIAHGIGEVRDQLVREGIFEPRGFRVALRAFADVLLNRWAREITDPPLREMLGELLDELVTEAAADLDRPANLN